MSDSTGGGMSPTQYMYMMALMNSGGGGGGGSQGGGLFGGASNAVSPIVRAMLLNRMMNAGTAQTPQQMTGYAPSMSPGQSGTGGFVAPYGPSSQGYSQSGAGYTPGGGMSMGNPYATPATAGAVAPTAAGGGIGGSPGVSTVSNPYGSYGYGYSNPYGISSTVPNY